MAAHEAREMVRHLPFFFLAGGRLMSCHRLETERLLLRPPEASDIAAMVTLAGDYDVAKNLSTMPHPYTDDDARSYLARAAEGRAKGSDFSFAITRRGDRAFMGITGAHLRDSGLFEMGYWLGKPYWGQGYATEAARKLAGFLFHRLKTTRVTAGYYHDNPASGRVLEKVGFQPDGASQRDCLARGHTVYCLGMLLERENFGRKPSA